VPCGWVPAGASSSPATHYPWVVVELVDGESFTWTTTGLGMRTSAPPPNRADPLGRWPSSRSNRRGFPDGSSHAFHRLDRPLPCPRSGPESTAIRATSAPHIEQTKSFTRVTPSQSGGHDRTDMTRATRPPRLRRVLPRRFTPIGGLPVVGCRLGAGIWGDADVIVGEGFPPDVALYTGV
jgi:hypothetical protein